MIRKTLEILLWEGDGAKDASSTTATRGGRIPMLGWERLFKKMNCEQLEVLLLNFWCGIFENHSDSRTSNSNNNRSDIIIN